MDKNKRKNLFSFITNKNKIKHKVGEVEFILDKHLKPEKMIGKGAYGQVIEAKDLSEKDPERQIIAIKKINDVFDHAVYAKRTLRELKILRLLAHENVSNYNINITNNNTIIYYR